MTISRRIILGFAAIGVLMVLLGGYAVSQVGRVRDTLDAVVKRDMGSLDELDQLQSILAHMVELRTTAVRQMVLQGAAEPAVLDEWGKSVVAVQHGVSVLQSEVQGYIAVQIAAERTPLWRRMAQQLDDAATNIAQLRANVETQFGAIHSGDRAAMIAQEPVVIADRKRVTDGVAAMRQTLRLVDAAGLREGGRVYDSSLYSVLGLLAVAIGVGVGVTLVTRRAITARIDDFERFAERVGAGELAVQTVTGQDEIGRLGGHLNQMVEGLRDLARQSREATVNLDGAANEIRASTQQQAAGVEEQLAAIQETAATVDEITHSGKQISRRAQEVIAAAQATAQTTSAGTAAIEGTVRAMDLIREQAETVSANIVELADKTRAIGEIISTVNDISERSHLLALNASIEAAAAGDQGRSFAIVATEMKTLADQAKDATRQVRSLLGEIQRGINASVMLTEEAVKRAAAGKHRTDTAQSTIEEMSGRIQESVQTFQQIVASTNQQQIGIEQVTLALQNIRQASQQTATSTRQLDQAAMGLTNLSQDLLKLVERYRL